MQLVHTPQQVFVYGTLKNGYGNHEVYLKDDSKFIGGCSVPGVLLQLKYFPALLPNDLCRVTGEVYEVTWKKIEELDRLEGTPNLYVRHQIQTPFGPCWTYYWAKEVHLTDNTLVALEGVWRGGMKDSVHYRSEREFFARRGVPTVSAPNTPPAHISKEPLALPVLANTQPPPNAIKVMEEPVVGPGLEPF